VKSPKCCGKATKKFDSKESLIYSDPTGFEQISSHFNRMSLAFSRNTSREKAAAEIPSLKG